MRFDYNAPVVLNFTLVSAIALLIQTFTPIDVMPFFTVYPIIDLLNPVWYLRLFSHVLGHADWAHFMGNFSFILLLGPILEEKYGSGKLLLLIGITALVTGILQIILFDAALMGASGIVFMMILLSSFSNAKAGHIPLTFVLVLVLYLGKEIITAFEEDQISQFAHIIGGVLGGVFGFTLAPRKKAAATPPASTLKF